jgi:hypothetical protein
LGFFRDFLGESFGFFWGGFFWGGFFWEDFFGGFFWEDFLGRIFWEDFLGRNSLFTLLKLAKLFESKRD